MKEYFGYIKARFKPKKYVTYAIFLLAIIITSIISLAGGMRESTQKLLEQIGYFMVASFALSLVVGFLGELSLGHGAFMSIGAMMGIVVQNIWFKSVSEVSPFLSLLIAMVIGGITAGVFGLLIGIPALRLKGDYLAIVTLAFGEIIKTLFQNSNFFGAALGLDNDYRFSTKYYFIFILFIAFLVLVLVNFLIKSKHGRAIMAIRDNEIAARAMGVNVTYYKVFVFVLSAVIAGIAGVLLAGASNHLKASTFDYNYSINNLLVVVVLGGMGSINGTIFATIIVTFLNVKLPVIFSNSAAVYKNVIFAIVLIVVVMYNNAPKLKYFREKYNVRSLVDYIKHKIFKKVNISKEQADQKDYGADWSHIPTKIDMDAIVTTDLEVDREGPDKPDKGGKKHE